MVDIQQKNSCRETYLQGGEREKGEGEYQGFKFQGFKFQIPHFLTSYFSLLQSNFLLFTFHRSAGSNGMLISITVAVLEEAYFQR
jgi:hypothetical protein